MRLKKQNHTIKIGIEVGDNSIFREYEIEGYEDEDWLLIVLEMIETCLIN